MKAKALKRAEETLDDPNANPRSVAAATRALLSATQTNLSSIDVALRAKHQEELTERLKELETWRESHGKDPQP
jgi:hypothetical protein